MLQQLIRPMALIKETWQSFLKTWDTTVRYSAWYIVIAIGSAISVYLKDGKIGSEFLAVIVSMITALASMYLTVMLFQIAFQIEDKKPVAISHNSEIWKKVANLLLAGILIAIPVIFCAGIIAVAVVLSVRKEVFLLLYGIPLVFIFLLALIYLGVRLTFIQAGIIDKNINAIEAIKHSWRITRNKFWAIFGRDLLAGLIFGSVTAVLILIGIIIVTVVSGINVGAEVAKSTPSKSIDSIVSLVQGIIMAGIMPLFYIYKVKLYRNVEKSQ